MLRRAPPLSAAAPVAAAASQKTASRRAGDIQQWPRIPVWPSWAGGRVIPMGLPNADPFLLVAHHKHWFDPRDPLRGPFRAFGKATGLPYICGGRELCQHATPTELGCDILTYDAPHRGFDILTYIRHGFRQCGNQPGRQAWPGGVIYYDWPPRRRIGVRARAACWRGGRPIQRNANVS